MKSIAARRRGSDRLGAKVFCYMSQEEKDDILAAMETSRMSMSAFVAGAAIAKAKQILSELPKVEPLSLDVLVSELKNGVAQSKIIVKVKRNGVTFQISDRDETLLRKSGAKGELLYQISQAGKKTMKKGEGDDPVQ